MSYREEYVWQRRHFQALLTSAKLQPSDPSPQLAEVASFMGAVSHCYDNDVTSVVTDLVSFLGENGPVVDPDLRRALVRLLGLLRARNAADPVLIIPLFFRLLQCNDKMLRRMIHGHIVADIKKLQLAGHPARRSLQSFLFTMVDDPSAVLVKRSLHVLVDLFRKRIWHDAKCANMIAHACFHTATPVAVIAAKFILDCESKDAEDELESEDDDNEGATSGGCKKNTNRDGRKASELWKAYNMTGKKSSKKRKRMERVINRMSRNKPNVTADAGVSIDKGIGPPALEAMMLLNDPQDFVERLFSDLQGRRRKEAYETRLVFINLITRLVGTHQLILFNMYPFLQRYLQPSQPEVTRVLAYLTQACHDLVPPDVLHPILRGLADTFVSERSSPPAMAAGINAIRAICSRVPLAILDEENEGLPSDEQEAPLLLDLVQYKSNKDQGVVMAGRSLISLYREVNPSLLHKRDRGKAAGIAVQQGEATRAKAYGEHLYATGVEGVELLHQKSSDDESEEDDSEEECPDEIEPVGDKDSAGKLLGKDDAVDKVGDSESAEENEVEDGQNDEDGEENIDEGSVDDREDADSESATKAKVGSGQSFSKKTDELKILTNEDFAKIRARQIAKAMGESALIKNTGDAVDPDDIQGPLKRSRQTLAERLESVMEGREGRDKFGSRKGLNKGGGSTNKKKLKTKSNSMVIHKRRSRAKQMGRRDRQLLRKKKNDY